MNEILQDILGQGLSMLPDAVIADMEIRILTHRTKLQAVGHPAYPFLMLLLLNLLNACTLERKRRALHP